VVRGRNFDEPACVVSGFVDQLRTLPIRLNA
jgi:hypothetical protein